MYERVGIFSVQDKNQHLLGQALPGTRAGNDHFAEFKTIHLRRNFFNIVWIIVLPVDDYDVFGAAGDDELAVCEDAAISRSQPAVPRVHLRLLFIVVIETFGDVATADVDIAD